MILRVYHLSIRLEKNIYPSDLKCKNSLIFLYEGKLVECEDYLDKSKYRDKTKLHNVIFKRYHEKIITESD